MNAEDSAVQKAELPAKAGFTGFSKTAQFSEEKGLERLKADG